jgi:hypothetical protein
MGIGLLPVAFACRQQLFHPGFLRRYHSGPDPATDKDIAGGALLCRAAPPAISFQAPSERSYPSIHQDRILDKLWFQAKEYPRKTLTSQAI